MFFAADYVLRDEVAVPRLWEPGGKAQYATDFRPYCYLAERPEEVIPLSEAAVLRVEPVERFDGALKRRLWKVTCKSTLDVVQLRDAAAQLGVESRETDLLFHLRHAIDKGVRFMDGPEDLRVAVLDSEMVAPVGFPRKERDPIIMFSLALNGDGKRQVEVLEVEDDSPRAEGRLLRDMLATLREWDPDVIATFNGNRFDWPYIAARAEKHNVPLRLGRDGSWLREKHHDWHAAGRALIDLYLIVQRDFDEIKDKDLKNVCDELGLLKKRDREMVEGDKGETIARLWRDDRPRLRKYAHDDALGTLLLAEKLLPTQYPLAKHSNAPLQDVAHARRGRHVELFFIGESVRRGMLFPNKQVAAAPGGTFEGAVVLQPPRGIVENVRVADFSSAYPTTIMAHNISAESLCTSASCTLQHHVAPFVGHKFHRFEDQPGFIPSVVRKLVDLRAPVKKLANELTKGTPEWLAAYCEQDSIKKIANSCYGFLGWSASRWYYPPVAESVTAWVRHYIQTAATMAREMGLTVYAGDTDSLFLNDCDDVTTLMGRVNAQLPVRIESEALYKRVFFTGAKKRYFCVDEKGKLKVRGLESRRGDWCLLAKGLQSAIIKNILFEADVQEGVRKSLVLARETVHDLKNCKVPHSQLVVRRTLENHPKAYKVPQAHGEAVWRSMGDRSLELVGERVGYFVLKGKEALNTRTKLEEYMTAQDWKNLDLDYYLRKQVLPAASRILSVLGVQEDAILGRPVQQSLDSATEKVLAPMVATSTRNGTQKEALPGMTPC